MSVKSLLQDGDISKDQEELIFDPYNPKNREITQTQVSEILRRYGVPDRVHNFKLYARAFIHRSYVKRPHLENVQNGIVIADKPSDCIRLKTKSNERLEFLGDGVLECITIISIHKLTGALDYLRSYDISSAHTKLGCSLSVGEFENLPPPALPAGCTVIPRR